MEFKRIPFIAVQRKFNLTDRQMYYIRDRIRKYHKEDEWFIFEYNAIGEKELWIYLEGVHWIEEVYLQYDTPYIEAEIQFVSKQIKRLEEELNVHCDPIHCEDMDIIELSIYFQKAKKTIYNEINKNRKDLEKYIIGKKPIKLSEEGVRWMELNLYRKRYMKDLYLYKRVMQDRKREKTMRQKLHEDDKRKRVNVLLSNNERELLKEKMDKYGYADLSSYLRDAGIYERLYLEDIDGKKKYLNLSVI